LGLDKYGTLNVLGQGDGTVMPQLAFDNHGSDHGGVSGELAIADGFGAST